MLKRLLIAVALSVAAPAWADTTAVYKSPTGMEMTVEISSNGNLRGTIGGRGDYVLSVDGEDYFVLFTDKGPVVDRVIDIVTALHGYMDRLVKDKKMPSFADMPDSPPFTFVKGGMVMIEGHAGICRRKQACAPVIPTP